MSDRRSFLRGLVSLPLAGGTVALLDQAAVAAVPRVPVIFDPAAFVADLMTAGYSVSAYRSIPRGGEEGSTPSYVIQPPQGCGFGAGYSAVMARWTGAIGDCPDHVERVVAYVFERHRIAFDQEVL